MTPKLSVSHVEDHDGRDGVCGHCQRENLRWIVGRWGQGRLGATRLALIGRASTLDLGTEPTSPRRVT